MSIAIPPVAADQVKAAVSEFVCRLEWHCICACHWGSFNGSSKAASWLWFRVQQTVRCFWSRVCSTLARQRRQQLLATCCSLQQPLSICAALYVVLLPRLYSSFTIQLHRLRPFLSHVRGRAQGCGNGSVVAFVKYLTILQYYKALPVHGTVTSSTPYFYPCDACFVGDVQRVQNVHQENYRT